MSHERIARAIVETLAHYNFSVMISEVVTGPTVYRFYLGRIVKVVPVPESTRVAMAKAMLPPTHVTVAGVQAVLRSGRVPTKREVKATISDIQARTADLRAAIHPNVLTGIDMKGFYLEVPVPERTFFSPAEVRNLAMMVMPQEFQVKHLVAPIGIGVDGTPVILDISNAPHVLVSGASNSGKSIAMHTIIEALVRQYAPDELAIVPMDFKSGAEFVLWTGLPHLTNDVITDPRVALSVLNYLVGVVNDRMKTMADARVQKIAAWNETYPDKTFPYILVVIDEIATLIDSVRSVNKPLINLGQRGRAAGIHFLVLTQSPRADVMTGAFKANFVTSLVMKTRDSTNSRISAGWSGAEQLMSAGDAMLITPDDPYPIRLQVALTTPRDIDAALEAANVFGKGMRLENLR